MKRGREKLRSILGEVVKRDLMVNNTSENLVFNQTDLHCVFHVVDLTLWDNKAFVVVDSNFQTMLKKSNILLLLM